MSPLPEKKSVHKWQSMPEARHPLIQDLIHIWEEAPGYSLPETSFLKDKVKLEAFIDSLVEMQKKAANPTAPAPAHTPVPPTYSEDARIMLDPHWEKKLAMALKGAAFETKKAPLKAPSVPLPSGFPELPHIPGAEDKLAKLKLVKAPTLSTPTLSSINNEKLPIPMIVLWALSMSAFILSCLALVKR